MFRKYSLYLRHGLDDRHIYATVLSCLAEANFLSWIASKHVEAEPSPSNCILNDFAADDESVQFEHNDDAR